MKRQQFQLPFRKLFWPLLLLLVCISAPLLYIWSERNIDSQNEQLISYMYARAQSTIWTVENALFLLPEKMSVSHSRFLAQMAQQPGIAWLALVAPNGEILADSDDNLRGKYLYTAREMKQLQPQSWIKGRFSPDEPDIFEAWKLLKPDDANAEAVILFAAFNFSAYRPLLVEYSSQLRWKIIIAALTGLSFIIILYLAFQFKISHTNLENAQAVALQVINNFPDGLLVSEPQGKIIYANNKLRSMLALSGSPRNLKNLPGSGWTELAARLSPAQPVAVAEISPPGETIFQATASRIPSSSGIAGFLYIIADKTEMKSRRDQMLEEKKFAALGKVAAGIAHEIRNPLGAMCGYAALLAEKLQNSQSDMKIAELLIEEGQRLNNVLTEMLALTRKPELHFDYTELSGLLAKLLMLAKPDADAKNIAIDVAYQNPKLKNKAVRLDKDRMLQAFLNILLNAISFSPPSSRISIFVGEIGNGIDKGLSISFTDAGPGISENGMGQIFNPYFTTKANGTGLGLTLSKNIVESHDGCIRAVNNEGVGATFTILLPAITPHEK